jgi:hypothetical protein
MIEILHQKARRHISTTQTKFKKIVLGRFLEILSSIQNFRDSRIYLTKILTCKFFIQ